MRRKVTIPGRPIRVFVAGIDIFYSREALRGIQDYAQSHGGWQFYMGGVPFDRSSFSPFALRSSNWMPDGMIVSIRSQEALGVAQQSGIAVVNNSSSMDTGLPTVIPDNEAVGRMAARHLMERGLRHFAHSHAVPGDRDLRSGGFARELARNGFECDLRYTRPQDRPQDRDMDRRDLSDWLAKLPKPAGIMANIDDEAMQVLWACQLLGLRIPEDVAILGVGNYEYAGSLWSPRLTSIELGQHRIGYRAAEMLDRLLHGKPAPARPVLISPLEVVTRESTDVIATSDSEIAQAVRMIRGNAHRPLSVKDILAAIPISRRSFERRFRRVVGRTPRIEINRVHMELAKRLLRETQMPIPDVAASAGFANRMAFATFFRRHAGMTPSQYRRSITSGSQRSDKTIPLTSDL